MFNRHADLASEDTSAQAGRSEEFSAGSPDMGVGRTLENQFHKRPLTSVLTAFGLGLSAGALVGCFLLRNWGKPAPSAAGSFGTQMKESLSGAVPDSIKQYFRD